MPRRRQNSDDRLTEKVFEQIRLHFAEGKPLRQCARDCEMATAGFIDRIQEAYAEGYLALKGKLAPTDAFDLQREWLTKHGRNVSIRVAAGCPDNNMFAHIAAERLLTLLRGLLEDRTRRRLTIGVVSGSSTGGTIEQLVGSRLWDETAAGVDNAAKIIDVVALNVTPLDGWELEGNANIMVLRLAAFLRERLPNCTVTPYGLSSILVVSENELHVYDAIPSNKKVLELSDPERVRGGKKSGLDLVVTGVGTPENSVFQQVLAAEGISVAKEMVGDVAFWPVDQAGNPLKLTRKGRKGRKETCLIYSAIRLKTFKELVESGAKVVLIARNKRRDQPVEKSAAILAAVKGGYANHFITDGVTADSL